MEMERIEGLENSCHTCKNKMKTHGNFEMKIEKNEGELKDSNNEELTI